jgi:hypothetical protein
MYQAEISRTNPTAFLFILDQSRSMSRSWGGGEERSKAQELADAINRLLYTLVMRCSKGDDVRDWFHVGVVGYGGDRVGPCLAGPLADETLVPVSRLAENPLRLERRAKKARGKGKGNGKGNGDDTSIKFPVWVEPRAKGDTPMCRTLALANEIIAAWTAEHATSYPPTVIHVTDGGSSDGDPKSAAAAVRKNETDDGATLLFNIHLSSKQGKPVRFPASGEGLADDYARMLFDMSSVLPPPLRREAEREGFAVSEASRGFAFNADLVSLVHFLDIGTRASNLR